MAIYVNRESVMAEINIVARNQGDPTTCEYFESWHKALRNRIKSLPFIESKPLEQRLADAKENDRIKVGDEVFLLSGRYGVVTWCNDQRVGVMRGDCNVETDGIETVEKTGRYYPELIEMMKKLGDGHADQS